MLISTTATQTWNNKNKRHYIEKGYQFTKIGESFEAEVSDLTFSSKAIVEVKCDYCGDIIIKKYQTYIKQHHEKFGDCCSKCQPKKNKMVCLEKYGVDNGAKTQNAINKTKATCLERYGIDNVSKLTEIKEKLSEASLKRNSVQTMQEQVKNNYNVDNIMYLQETKDKIKETMLNNYGVTHPKKSEEIKDREKKNNIEKYGVENVSQVPEFKEKSKKTCLEKYGTEYSLQSPLVRQKIMESLLKHGNVPTSSQQIELFNLLEKIYGKCELNLPCGLNFLDCVVEYKNVKIDVEYDCWYWHQDEQRDRRRDEFVKSKGYKVLRIVGSREIPEKSVIINAIENLANSSKRFLKISMV